MDCTLLPFFFPRSFLLIPRWENKPRSLSWNTGLGIMKKGNIYSEFTVHQAVCYLIRPEPSPVGWRWLSQSEHLCSPKFVYWNLIPKVMAWWGGPLGGDWVTRAEPSWLGSVVLYKKPQSSLPSREDTVRSCSLQPGRGPAPEPNHLRVWAWTSSLQIWEK